MVDQSGTGSAAITRRTVRGKWTAQQRHEIVEASLVAGASINDVAQKFGIRANLLTAWRRRHAEAKAIARRKASAVSFAAVSLKLAPTDGTIEIDLSNRLIRVRGIVDARMLREVLAATR